MKRSQAGRAGILFKWFLWSETKWQAYFVFLLLVQLVHVDSTGWRSSVVYWNTLSSQWSRAQVIKDHLRVHIHRLNVLIICLLLRTFEEDLSIERVFLEDGALEHRDLVLVADVREVDGRVGPELQTISYHWSVTCDIPRYQQATLRARKVIIFHHAALDQLVEICFLLSV